MAPFIFGTKEGIHIIDLKKTKKCLALACKALYSIALAGKKIFFVGTKPQARSLVVETAKKLDMPYVGERWLGGLFTNFSTIRSSLRKLQSIEKMMKTAAYQSLSKKECLMIERDKNKRLRLLGGIASINRLPAAVFVVDINVENIAVAEAKKLNIPIFAMVDTNVNPNKVDYPIPANDDSREAIRYVLDQVTTAVQQALQDRKEGKTEKMPTEEKKVTMEAVLEAPKEQAASHGMDKEAAAVPTAPLEGAKKEASPPKRRRISTITRATKKQGTAEREADVGGEKS